MSYFLGRAIGDSKLIAQRSHRLCQHCIDGKPGCALSGANFTANSRNLRRLRSRRAFASFPSFPYATPGMRARYPRNRSVPSALVPAIRRSPSPPSPLSRNPHFLLSHYVTITLYYYACIAGSAWHAAGAKTIRPIDRPDSSRGTSTVVIRAKVRDPINEAADARLSRGAVSVSNLAESRPPNRSMHPDDRCIASLHGRTMLSPLLHPKFCSRSPSVDQRSHPSRILQ